LVYACLGRPVGRGHARVTAGAIALYGFWVIRGGCEGPTGAAWRLLL